MRKPIFAAAALAAAALATAATAVAAPLSSPEEAGRYEFPRSLQLPHSPQLTSLSQLFDLAGPSKGLREGGLSALQVVPGTLNTQFYSISDRGPNGQPTWVTGANSGRTFPDPSFSPLIYRLAAGSDGQLHVISRTPIKVKVPDPVRSDAKVNTPAADSHLITGLRNVTPFQLDDKIFLYDDDTHVSEYTPTDPYGLDTEGIQRDPRDGSFWISDEYRPSVAHVAADGTLLARIAPIGSAALPTAGTDGSTGTLGQFYGGASQPKLNEVLPSEWKARRQNRGIEGVALSSDGKKLYASLQNPIDGGNANAAYQTYGYGAKCLGSSDGNSTSANFFHDVRIAEIDISNPSNPKLTGEWLYRIDTVSSTDATAQGNLKVSDIAWAGNRKLYVDEHDDVALTHRNIYEVDLSKATNIATAPSLDTLAELQAPAVVGTHASQPLGCYLDNGSIAELKTLGVTTLTNEDTDPAAPVNKVKYLDIGPSPAGVGFLYPKVEGIAPLDGVPGIAIVNDNDFGFADNATTALTSQLVEAGPDTATEQVRIYTSQPKAVGLPHITGSTKAGSTLTAIPPALYSGVGYLSYDYEWTRDGSPVGTDSSRYRLGSADVGHKIAVTITATRTWGAVVAQAAPVASAPTAAIAPAPAPKPPHHVKKPKPHHGWGWGFPTHRWGTHRHH